MIKEILEKMASGNNKGLSPDEVELNSYLEKERRDKIKILLGKFRNQETEEMFGQGTIFKEGKGILHARPTLIERGLPGKNKQLLHHNSNMFFI